MRVRYDDAVTHNPCTEGRPVCWVILFNLVKQRNVGNLMRTAVALGARLLVTVGAQRLLFLGAKGTRDFIPVRPVATLADARALAVDAGLSVCGVEITPEARPIGALPFRGGTAFILGNEGDGLSPAAKAVCDHFVYIPQHSVGTASLNVAAAAAIVLQRFAEWAAFREAPRAAGVDKFAVASMIKDASFGGVDAELVRAERAARREEERAAPAESSSEG
jgi:tRNA G18 (ribose-2'-O)-methylase SpoU